MEETDFYLLKMNSDGLLEWEMIYGGDDRDVAYSTIQTEDGGYIITGYTRSYGSGNNDVWIIKTDEFGQTCDYSTNGNCYMGSSKWVRTYGNGLNQIGRSMVEFVDADIDNETKFAILSQEEHNSSTNIGLYLIDSNGDGFAGSVEMHDECLNDVSVQSWVLSNFGHTWPSMPEADIHAASVIWNFVKQYDMNGLINE